MAAKRVRIVNTTGNPMDTKVYDASGREIGAELQLTSIEIAVGKGFNVATFTAIGVELDIVAEHAE